MQIHELDTAATLGTTEYVPIDNGTQTRKTNLRELNISESNTTFQSYDTTSPTTWTALNDTLVSGALSTLMSFLSKVVKNVRFLYNRIGNATLQTTEQNLSGAVNEHEQDIANLNSGLTATNSNVSTLASDVDSVETGLSSLQSEVDEVEVQLNDYVKFIGKSLLSASVTVAAGKQEYVTVTPPTAPDGYSLIAACPWSLSGGTNARIMTELVMASNILKLFNTYTTSLTVTGVNYRFVYVKNNMS